MDEVYLVQQRELRTFEPGFELLDHRNPDSDRESAELHRRGVLAAGRKRVMSPFTEDDLCFPRTIHDVSAVCSSRALTPGRWLVPSD